MRTGLGVKTICCNKTWFRFVIYRFDEFWGGEGWLPDVRGAVLYADFDLAIEDCFVLFFEQKPKMLGDEGEEEDGQ